MTDREIEARLKEAVENITPDVLESIMSECDNLKGDVIVMTKANNKNKGLGKKIASIAAALIVVAGAAGFGYNYYRNENAIASTVLFDVNPSVGLELNKKANVIAANALNSDGEKILENLELKGTNANTATSAIIGSLLQNGYIDELANSILISVDDKNAERGAQLQQQLAAEASKAIEAASANAAIVAQHMDAAAYDEVAAEYKISNGKAALIEKIIAANPTYTEKDLAQMSINELNLILSNPKNEVKEVATSGTASAKEYIGAEKAKEIALEHFGIKKADTYNIEVDFDNEGGKLVYEVEIKVKGKGEYEAYINALTGEILRNNAKPAANSPAAENNASGKDIGKAKAQEIALNRAGFKAAEVENLKVVTDYDDGRLEYNVKFIKGNKGYEYEVDAATGNITDFDIESKIEALFEFDIDEKYDDDDKYDLDDKYDDDDDDDDDDYVPPANNKNSTTAASGDIGKAKAKEIALNRAGIKEAQAKRLRVEREYDDGRLEYSVEFRYNGREYEYEINGATGAIISSDVERD